MEREKFASRLGFLAMTAGCAIGLGNVWRFPYIVGAYGGAVFVVIYLICLALIGFPVMVAELALGRASQSDLPEAYGRLAQKNGRVWSGLGTLFFTGNCILLMFYVVITGWLFSYFWHYLAVGFPAEIPSAQWFGQFLADWPQQLLFTLIVAAVTAGICALGVCRGIERAMKIMLGGLFVLQLVMIVFVLTFDGSGAGVRFFLAPDLGKLRAAGAWPVIHAAMMQAFFTLSLGIGSVEICGSYINKEHSLTKEAICVICLDTLAALASGMIIFPACFAFNVSPDQGPSLIFVTLNEVFRSISGGRVLGALFFLFMCVAALSTMVAVAENIIAWLIRVMNWSRPKASLIFACVLSVLSLPCLFGFNLLKNFQPMGKGSCVLDLEDFILSDNLLPLGALAILLFCTRSFGWGIRGFLAEADQGRGMRFPRWCIWFSRWVLPLVIFGLWLHNFLTKFWFK